MRIIFCLQLKRQGAIFGMPSGVNMIHSIQKRTAGTERALLLSAWLLFGVLSKPAAAQEVQGHIRSKAGEPLPYANVGIQGSSLGTTANSQGHYQLKLPEAGSYTLLFQYLGYQSQSRTLRLAEGETQTLDLWLHEERVQLQEVEVAARGPGNPAVAMVRKAIERKEQNHHPVKAYQCRTYVKGVQRVRNLPDRLMGMDIEVEGFEEGQDSGILYLSESVSRLYYREGAFREEMIASRVSGDPRGYSWNSSLYFQFSFYEDFVLREITERGLVSPLSDNAFFYYDYRLLGQLEADGQTVYKIQVIPKRKHDPVWRGNLYLVDSLWALQGVRLSLQNPKAIDFVDSGWVRLRYQAHGPQQEAYLPQKAQFQLYGGFMGVEFTADYVGNFSNYSITPFADDLAIADTFGTHAPASRDTPSASPPKNKTAQKPRLGRRSKRDSTQPDSLVQRKLRLEKLQAAFHSRTVVRIDPEANTRDSAYWERMRPVPLTAEERTDYRRKDSIREAHTQPAYLDSVRRENNRFRTLDLLTGYRFRTADSLEWGFASPLNAVGFNPVEGWYGSFEPYVRDRLARYHIWELHPRLRGGEAGRFFAALESRYRLGQFERMRLAGGTAIRQYGQGEASSPLQPLFTPGEGDRLLVSPIQNTIDAQANAVNRMRLYRAAFASAFYENRLLPGLDYRLSMGWESRRALRNKAEWRADEADEAEFAPNTPVAFDGPRAPFPRHDMFIGEVQLRYSFGERYIRRPDEVVIYHQQPVYTDLGIALRQGVHPGAMRGDFLRVELALAHERPLGLLGRSFWSLLGGAWLDRPGFFQDYRHFEGNRFLLRSRQAFFLLPYYRRSTQEAYLRAGWRHDFGGFVFNKLPGLRRLPWKAVAQAEYLYTPEWVSDPHYLEAAVGVDDIFRLLEVSYAQRLLGEGPDRRAVRLSFPF